MRCLLWLEIPFCRLETILFLSLRVRSAIVIQKCSLPVDLLLNLRASVVGISYDLHGRNILEQQLLQYKYFKGVVHLQYPDIVPRVRWNKAEMPRRE